MDLSTASDDVLEVLAFAAIVNHPMGPIVGALILSEGAERSLPAAEAARWNRAIAHAVKRASASAPTSKHENDTRSQPRS